MMDLSIAARTDIVLLAVLVISVLFGLIGRASHFCTLGALGDWVHFGDLARLRMWALAAGIGTLGFHALVALGLVLPEWTIYGSSIWLWGSALVGGALFGAGMVLSSGCPSKTLIRLGGGNLKSVVVLLVMGLSAWMTMRGLTAVWRVATVDQLALELSASQTLSELLAGWTGMDRQTLAAWVGLGVGGGLVAWVIVSPEGQTREVLLGGLGIGGLVVAIWWVTGVFGHLAEHPETLQEDFLGSINHRMEGLSLVSPLALGLEWLVFYSDRSRTLSLGIVAVIGIPLGSALHATWTRSLCWEGFHDVPDLRRHLLGAVLMGVGGVTAMGCSIGQGLTGLSTLGLTSLTAVFGIVVGAVPTLRYLAWRVEQDALALGEAN
jgi:uncharacterized membrane protein YedE/YeeE